jgi:hypothetical protein
MAGSPPFRTADVFCDQVCSGGAFKGAWACGDDHYGNLKTHTALGSLLVREPGSPNSLINSLWFTRLPITRMPIASSGGARISRRIVTYNHHRRDARDVAR